MKHSNTILFGLIGLMCMLHVVGFSQDTLAVSEPIHSEKISSLPNIQKSPSSSESIPFRLKAKNPKTATWLSVALPGAGQVYNGQWWKVPIIYAGVGALVYFHRLNSKELDIYQTEYRSRIANDTLFMQNSNLRIYTTEQITSIRNYYQRNIEFVYILSGALYLLNIIDACVFAHLSTFDVSDNLSMRIQPFASPDFTPYAAGQQFPMQGGLKLTFTLK